jgi:calcium/calmodulin-dependent protein kinase I
MIADFGLSKITFGNNEALYTTCGTPGYMAPEIIQGFDGYGKGVDMWAIGVITYFL